MDFLRLASLLDMDEADFRELVELFISVTLADLDKIRKGIHANHPEEAAAGAHSIKGAAGNLGFEALAALARTMEAQAKSGSLDKFEIYMADLEAQVQALAGKLDSISEA